MSEAKWMANDDLTVGDDGLPGWNQPARRRIGFHQAHSRWRRVAMIRSRKTLVLRDEPDAAVAAAVEATGLTRHSAFSALVVAEGDRVLHEAHAEDFSTSQPHSIQSITKLHAHLIFGELVAAGRVDLADPVSHYLPWMGTAYATSSLGDVLDMKVVNDFTEDYEDLNSDCYTEEEALGWRLPAENCPETTMRNFVASLTGDGKTVSTGFADYKSANTDVLTLIAAAAGVEHPLRRLEAIADAAGYEGGFYISLSLDLLPALSGGVCLSARDLARFGLLLARQGVSTESDEQVGDAAFTELSRTRQAPALGLARHWIRYSNHLMTDGRWIGHSGYGGQFLMVNIGNGRAASYLSVLENSSGHDESYMTEVIRSLECLLEADGPKQHIA